MCFEISSAPSAEPLSWTRVSLLTNPTPSIWQAAVLAYASAKCDILFTSIGQIDKWLRKNPQDSNHSAVRAVGRLLVAEPKVVECFTAPPATAVSLNRPGHKGRKSLKALINHSWRSGERSGEIEGVHECDIQASATWRRGSKQQMACLCLRLKSLQFVHEGRRLHPTIEAAQKEARTKAHEILGEKTNIDWREGRRVMGRRVCGDN